MSTTTNDKYGENVGVKSKGNSIIPTNPLQQF
jgi:hypothetical protein